MRESARRFIGRLDDPSIERLAMLAILALAVAARVAFAMLFPDQSAILGDSLTYRAAASDLASGHLIANHVVMPGYPLLIALSGGGAGQFAADLAVSVLSVWCVARIARQITGDALYALAAGLIWAVYPFSLFYAKVGLTETLYVALVLLGFLALYRAAFLQGIVAMVAAILTRPAIEPLTPILILTFSLVVHRTGWKQALRQLGVFAAVYGVMMAPWWWHNEAKYGQFVRLNLGGGTVLYAGNNPMNISGGGIGWIDHDPAAFSNISDPVARDRAKIEAGVRYILEDPQHFLHLAWLKVQRLWRLWPYAKIYATPILIFVSVATIAPLMLCAAAGLVIGMRRSWRLLVPILMFIGFTTAVHIVTIGSIRYRFPMEPLLVVLAAPVVGNGIKRLAAAPAAQRRQAPVSAG